MPESKEAVYVWNFNMDEAPRGQTKKVVRLNPKKQEYEMEVFVPDVIIVAGKEEGLVTLTRWLPKEGRWNMFSKGQVPKAWMPWPEYPKGG